MAAALADAAATSKPVAFDGACSFCRFQVRRPADSAYWAVAFETEQFVAVPSVGALVPGWLLVLPREHYVSMVAMSDSDLHGLDVFVASVLVPWQRIFGAVTMFEHGPCAAGRPAGCGVDHAHLHIVPTAGIDLVAGVREQVPDLNWSRVESLAHARRVVPAGHDYLFIRSEDRQSWLATAPEVPSQALRRVMAAELGCPDEFDWRANPRLDVVRGTIRRFARAAR